MLKQFLMRWFPLPDSWRPKRASLPIAIDFYTRTGCHLCEEALAELELATKRFSLLIRSIDIDQDQALVKQYGELVPVVVVQGRERFHGRVNRVLLERLLRAETRGGG